MAQSEVEKNIEKWVAALNKHKGEEWVPWLSPYPVDPKLDYIEQQALEWITKDNIRFYAAGIGDRNPLFWSEDYARRTRWGGIIAPPCFTDSIAISWISFIEPSPVPWYFQSEPAGNKRELFKPIRPGDRITILEKYLGIEERKPREPRPYRLFLDRCQKSFMNQNEETVAVLTYSFARLITSSPPDQRMFRGADKKQRYKFSDEERDAILRSYEANKRRGADTLFWEDVSVGDEVPMLPVGPTCSADSIAFHCAQQGHVVAFDMKWDRINQRAGDRKPEPDPETNAYWSVPYVHACDGRYGFGYLLGYQMEGLLARMLTDWMGDDGFLKVLDCRFRALPIIGDAFYQKGKVTGKRVEDGEHLVDLDLRTDNQVGELIVSGTATVRLLARTT